jgi:hypothetical protein
MAVATVEVGTRIVTGIVRVIRGENVGNRQTFDVAFQYGNAQAGIAFLGEAVLNGFEVGSVEHCEGQHRVRLRAPEPNGGRAIDALNMIARSIEDRQAIAVR